MGLRSVTRRRFLRMATTTALAGAMSLAPRLLPRKRNVVVILVDSLRRDALSCYGSSWVRTPNLDAFASRAVRCVNAFNGSFPTVPARHDFLTGTYTFTYKHWSPLESRTLTLQKVLGGFGVHTSLIADTPHPYRNGFDYQRDFRSVQIVRGQENDNYRVAPGEVCLPCKRQKLRDPGAVAQYLRNVAPRRTEEDYFCAQTCRAAADWLRRNHRRQPFFLFVDMFDPHEPWDPPASYMQTYDPTYTGEDVIYPRYDRWNEFLSQDELRRCRALYAAETTLVDRWLGHLLQTVSDLGLLENTMLVVLADHGIYLGEHGYIGKAIIRPGGFQNLPLYPELCRIPFLIHYPGCDTGTVMTAPVQTFGIAATILDFLGLPTPEDFAAPSFWPLLAGMDPGQGLTVSAPTLSDHSRRPPNATDRATVGDGRWLLIYSCAGNPDPAAPRHAPLSGELLAPELYDLATDSACVHNVFAQNRDRATDLHRQFFAFLERSPMFQAHLDYFRALENH
jgi:arylsulfatase A-like enzyme